MNKEEMNLTGCELIIPNIICNCPCCGSNNLQRENFDFDNEGGQEYWSCDDCKSTWDIIYNVNYSYHFVTRDDHNFGEQLHQYLIDRL